MPRTEVRSAQIKDATIGRADLDTATAGSAVVAKIVAGTGISISSTGADTGTGDVTVTATGGSGTVIGPIDNTSTPDHLAAWRNSNGTGLKDSGILTTGLVVAIGSLTADAVVLGNGTTDIKVLGSLGTTTQVLHGNASGAPTWSSVSLANDVTGSLAQSSVTNLTSDLALKAPLASPALTGTPTAPTASSGTDTTQVATTAFVTASFVQGPASAVVDNIATFNATSGKVIKDSGVAYSVGTWTPSLFNTGSGTYTRQLGTYIRIGRLVVAWYDIIINTASFTGGTTQLDGLPVAASLPSGSTQMTVGLSRWSGTTSSWCSMQWTFGNADTLRPFLQGVKTAAAASAFSHLFGSEIAAGMTLAGFLVYPTT